MKRSWEFEEGHEIAPGRTVLKSLGGGNRYEVYLVWDERLFAVMVAKVVRPDLVDDESALRGLRREAEALDALAHPVVLRGFGSRLDGPHPHVLVEHLEGPTLRRLIKRGGPLPLEQALPLGLHVAAASREGLGRLGLEQGEGRFRLQLGRRRQRAVGFEQGQALGRLELGRQPQRRLGLQPRGVQERPFEGLRRQAG